MRVNSAIEFDPRIPHICAECGHSLEWCMCSLDDIDDETNEDVIMEKRAIAREEYEADIDGTWDVWG